MRLQLVLALGSAMLLAFVPLFYAVATYTRIALQDLQRDNAAALGRAVAGQVVEARAHRSPDDLQDVLAAQIGSGIAAVAVYDPGKNVVFGAGETSTLERISAELTAGGERLVRTRGKYGDAVAVAVPSGGSLVVTLVRTDVGATRFVPLVKLLALYIGVVGLVLLVVTYLALGYLLVRPVDALSRAAQRVADGARRFTVPSTSVRELDQLGTSLETMAARLIAEEEALRRKIDEVERKTAELSQAQKSLVHSEKLASVGRLAAGLAHEVGNPIAAIIGIQDLLLAGGLPEEEQRDFMARMRKETERVNRILRDLLQFARPKADSKEPGDVEGAIHDTVTLVTPQRELSSVDLSLDVFRDLPLVRLPREQLVQVLLNLILNAAHACEQGGTVRVRAMLHGGSVRVEVEDTGPGVSTEAQESLFEPFFSTKEVGKGTGLGLSVCKGLIEAAGGSIRYDADYEAGARFVIDLPPADDAVKAPQGAAQAGTRSR